MLEDENYEVTRPQAARAQLTCGDFGLTMQSCERDRLVFALLDESDRLFIGLRRGQLG